MECLRNNIWQKDRVIYRGESYFSAFETRVSRSFALWYCR